MNFLYKKLRNRKGFSLIELIVVISILGILAVVAVPRVTMSLDKARQNTDSANLRTLQSTVELFFVEQAAYPLAGDTDPTKGEFVTAITSYLPNGVPKPQVTGNHFYYFAASTGPKVVYAATAAAAVTAGGNGVAADWIQID